MDYDRIDTKTTEFLTELQGTILNLVRGGVKELSSLDFAAE